MINSTSANAYMHTHQYFFKYSLALRMFSLLPHLDCTYRQRRKEWDRMGKRRRRGTSQGIQLNSTDLLVKGKNGNHLHTRGVNHSCPHGLIFWYLRNSQKIIPFNTSCGHIDALDPLPFNLTSLRHTWFCSPMAITIIITLSPCHYYHYHNILINYFKN